jgi:asparaginyl-tRNA synthetase
MLFRRYVATLPPTIRQLLSSPTTPPGPIRVDGWVKSVRRQKRVSFAVITDGSYTPGLQVVLDDGDMAKKCVSPPSTRLTCLC